MKSEKIAMARALLNTRAIDDELSTYNLHQLSKSAAVGAYKEERLKVAALIRQSELEKQAFLSAFCNLEKRANRWRAAWNAAKGLGSYAAKKLGPTTKAVQSKVGPGATAITRGIGRGLDESVQAGGELARETLRGATSLPKQLPKTMKSGYMGRQLNRVTNNKMPTALRLGAAGRMARSTVDRAGHAAGGAMQGFGKQFAKRPLGSAGAAGLYYGANAVGNSINNWQADKTGRGAMAGARQGFLPKPGFSPGLGGLDGKQSPINWKGGRGFPPQGTGKQSPINWGPDGPAGDLPTHSTGPDGKQSPINWGPAGPAGGLPR